MDLEVCDCRCHNSIGPSTTHNFPCCKPCEYCNKNVRYKYYDDHVSTCPSKKELEEQDTEVIDLGDLELS